MKVQILLLALLSLLQAAASQYCWDFTSTRSEWNDLTAQKWQWSATSAVVTAYVPNFVESPDPPFMFLQDISESYPFTGILESPPITIYPGSRIDISIYRHLVNYDVYENPSLSFHTATSEVVLAESFNTDFWDNITTTCDGVSCCPPPATSCTGTLRVKGVLYAKEEILGVDSIGINSPNCR